MVTARALERLQAMYRTALWSAQVDDVSRTKTTSVRCTKAVQVYRAINEEVCLAAGIGQNHGGGYNGSHAMKLAEVIGLFTMVGLWCEKLGVDCGLAGKFEPQRTLAGKGCGRRVMRRAGAGAYWRRAGVVGQAGQNRQGHVEGLPDRSCGGPAQEEAADKCYFSGDHLHGRACSVT